MLELLKKIVALVPVGHELYEAISALLKELCDRVTAAETIARENREMLAARADQVGELATRVALVERMERGPELATAIKDVRLDSLEDTIARLEARLGTFERTPDVKFVAVDDATPAPEIAAAAPPAASVQCAFHPHAPMNGSACLFPECTWPGIDNAA